MCYEFCPNGTSLFVIWGGDGRMSPCAADIIFPTIMATVLIVRITILLLYPTSAQPLEFARPAKSRPVYRLQLALIALFPLQYLLQPAVLLLMKSEHFVWMFLYTFLVFCLIYAAVLFVTVRESDSSLKMGRVPADRHSFLLRVAMFVPIALELVPVMDLLVAAWIYPESSSANVVQSTLWMVRLLHAVGLFALCVWSPGLHRKSRRPIPDEEDTSSTAGLGSAGYRLTSDTESTWKNSLAKARFLWPYVWPKGEPLLQLRVLVCFVLLLAGRVANVFLPIFYEKVVTALSKDDLGSIPLSYIFGYCAIYLLTGSGSSGMLSNLRTFLWIRVQQFSGRRTMVHIFSHLHNLSLRWHLGRKTGEVLGVIDRGRNSVVQLLSYFVFTIFPIVADILIAVMYFIFAFNLYFGLIVFACLALYLAVTIVMSEWRTKFRRQMNKLDNDTRSKAVDSLINFETVKYYGAEKFEVERYDHSYIAYQECEWKTLASLSALNVTQALIVNLGLVAGCLLCAHYIVADGGGDSWPVGKYVLFTTYIMQLYGPLNFFGTYYRMIMQSFIDIENMLDLMTEPVEIKDTDSCPQMVVSEGRIDFDHVSFHYVPEKQILKDVSFSVPAGSTVAVVGPSGSGKSTLIRLLFRFYDVTSGSIRIDGQDIREVQQNSLRCNIGVVPQDTVLFNDTIRYNVRYGRPGSSDAEVEGAAAMADMHARIMEFPDRYETMVGERGLKLSGGEKQRVAIARTVLKAPRVVLLDEATSALDTKTERNIQKSLDAVSVGRTTLIVAHRLSTIVHADQILVLSHGVIVERGTHAQLLATPGSAYADMWNQQQQSAAEIEADMLDLKDESSA